MLLVLAPKCTSLSIVMLAYMQAQICLSSPLETWSDNELYLRMCLEERNLSSATSATRHMYSSQVVSHYLVTILLATLFPNSYRT